MPKPINPYHEALLAKEVELRLQLQNREGVKIEGRAADPLDETAQSANRVEEMARLNRAAKTLQLVKAAISRILHGEFGECLGCGCTIPETRLKVVPWAERCVPCQDQADRAKEAKGSPRRLREYDFTDQVEGINRVGERV